MTFPRSVVSEHAVSLDDTAFACIPPPVYMPGDCRLLFDDLAVPLLWIAQSTITDANEACCRWLGYEPDQLIGQPLRRLIPSADAHDPHSPWQAVTGSRLLVHADIGVLDAVGTVRHASVNTYGSGAAAGSGRVLLLRPERHADLHAPDCAQQSALAYELTAAEVRERRRIANGLHDEIGQVLAIIGLKLAALGTTQVPDDFTEQIKELLSFVAQAQQATRSATFELSCPVLQHMGLQAAIEGLAERLDGVAGLSIHVDGAIPLATMPEPVMQTVFRVVRELLMNAIKHSRAHHAWVDIAASVGELRIRVRDDGVGMPTGSPRPMGRNGGYGLHNIEAQLLAVGGRVALASAPGGTQIDFAVPLAATN